MPSLRFPVIIAVLTLVVIYVTTRKPPERILAGNAEMAADITNRLGIVLASTAPDTSTNRNEKLEKAFDHQLKQYDDTLATFGTNLFMQAALVIFAVFLVFSEEETLDVPVIGLKLQRSWLYFIVPGALLYLWLRFGFLLDSLIKTRVLAWELYRQMAVNPTAVDMRSGAALFEDSGFLDGWFVCFRNGNEHLIRLANPRLVYIIFLVVFGILLGANHACVVAVAHIGNARIQKGLDARRGLRAFLWALPGLMAFFLFASHVLFYQGGRNPNKLQLVIALFALAFMFGLVFLARAGSHSESEALHQESYDAVAP